MLSEIMQLAVKLNNLIKKGKVSRETTDDSGNYLNMQITSLGKISQGQVIFPYGINAVPPKDTLGLCFNVLGSEDMIYFLPFAMTERFKNLKSGEVKVGSVKHKNFIYFAADGSIKIESESGIDIIAKKDVNLTVTGKVNVKASGNVNIDAPQTNLGVGGKKIALNGDSVSAGVIVATGTNTSI